MAQGAPAPKGLARAWEGLKGLVLAQLLEGTAPERLALACALGLWIGLIPVLGVSTVLCAALAAGFRLNQAVIQAVNFVAYPLQLALLFPFFALGARVFGGPRMDLAPVEFLRQAGTHPLALAGRFWLAGVHALAVWAALGALAVPLAWAAQARLFARLAPRPKPGSKPGTARR